MTRLTALATVLTLLSAPALAQPAVVGVVTEMWAGTDAKAGQDLTALDGLSPSLRVVTMGGRGAIENLRDILFLRGVDAGFVPSDAVAYARDNNLIAPADLAKIEYVAKLYDEEVHILAVAGIKSISDLNGKRVNVDVAGSGSAMTADVILRALNINATVTHDPQAVGMLALRHGTIDALIQVGGAPVPLLAGVPADAHLHFVPILMSGDLARTYLPSTITHDEYPALVGDDPVPTLAIGDVLAVFGWDRASPRYANVAKFVDALYDHISDLQQPPHHPKWKDVNLAASVPGWVRFPEATARLKDKYMIDSINALASDKRLKGIPPELMATLLRDYEEWRSRGVK